jgi:hypothetical protein
MKCNRKIVTSQPVHRSLTKHYIVVLGALWPLLNTWHQVLARPKRGMIYRCLVKNYCAIFRKNEYGNYVGAKEK